jgi:hypothetical protein
METTTNFRIAGSSATALPFTGTPEEALANWNTHSFDAEYARCSWCDCRPWGVWANYPCGNGDRIVEQRVIFEDGREVTRVVTIINGKEVIVEFLD